MVKPFADRLKNLGTETAFEVLARVNDLKNKGTNVVSFCIGEPDFATPKNIREAAKKAIDDEWTHYGPSAGLDVLRNSIAKYISQTRNIPVERDNVVVVPGGKPIIFYAVLALVNEGDEVIYPNPGFPIYESMINFVGGKAIPIPLLETKEFSFDIEDFKKLVNDNTKLVILNSPANPTCGVIPKEDLGIVAELAKKHDFWVLSDEIYSRILYDGKFESITQFEGMPERTIILDGHSKTYAMTGWRLGYGVMPKELAKWVAQLMTNSNSCTASFIQIAGAEALDGPQDESETMIAEFKARRDIVVDGLNKIEGIKCLKPHGAFYVFPNVTQVCKKLGFKDSNQVQDYLLYHGHVAVLSRMCFGKRNIGEDEEYIRLSYATSQDNIREGLKRIEKALKNEEAIAEFLAEEAKK